MRPASRSLPSPTPSTPQLFDTVRRPPMPCSSKASMSTNGMPQSPNPPTARLAPSGMSATASVAVATVLSMPGTLRDRGHPFDGRQALDRGVVGAGHEYQRTRDGE